MAVADVYDALVTDRVYRPAMTEAKALEIMEAERSRHFAPDVFACFLDTLPEFRSILAGTSDGTPEA